MLLCFTDGSTDGAADAGGSGCKTQQFNADLAFRSRTAGGLANHLYCCWYVFDDVALLETNETHCPSEIMGFQEKCSRLS